MIQEADVTLTILLLGYASDWRDFLRRPQKMAILSGYYANPVGMKYREGTLILGLSNWAIVIPQGDAVLDCLKTLRPHRIDYTIDLMATLPPELSQSVLRSRSWIDKNTLVVETSSGIRVSMLMGRGKDQVESPALCGSTLYYEGQNQAWFSLTLDTAAVRSLVQFAPCS